jgi:hypothetical protein
MEFIRVCFSQEMSERLPENLSGDAGVSLLLPMRQLTLSLHLVEIREIDSQPFSKRSSMTTLTRHTVHFDTLVVVYLLIRVTIPLSWQ